MNQPISFSISRRGLVRLVSFASALVVTLGAGTAVGYTRAAQYQLLLEDHYAQALTGLSSNLAGVAVTLQKAQYAAGPTQAALLAARLWRDTSAAKTALTSLPVGGLHLDNTNRFLSQVGDYAMALARKSVSGVALSEQERTQFAGMCAYGRGLADGLRGVEQAMAEGEVSMERLQQEIDALSAADGAPPPSDALTAFQAVEESFADYPTLVYDGAFSDHLTNQPVQMLLGAQEVTPEAALHTAAAAAGMEPAALTRGEDENSRFPSYTFSGEGIWLGVTKAGGYLATMLKSRAPEEPQLEPATAVQAAADFIQKIGLSGLLATRYEVYDGVCTVVFAATQGDVVLHPDQIRLEVALDNGEVLAYDARGYLASHRTRELPDPAITPEDAVGNTMQNMQVLHTRRAMLPTSGGSEILCYELYCVTPDGARLLAYLNTQTGTEEELTLVPDGGSIPLFPATPSV